MILKYSEEFLARAFTFDETHHEYRVDGQKLFPTTTVVNTWHRVCRHEMPDFTEEHRNRGTILHEIIEADIRGRLDELNLDPEVLAEFEPQLEANRGWRELVGYEPLWIENPDGTQEMALEIRGWHPSGFGWTADSIGIAYGKVGVQDWKSSWISGAELQTAGYELGIEFAFGVKVETRAAIGHGRDGTFRPHPFDNPQDKRAFNGCLWLLNEAARRGELK